MFVVRLRRRDVRICKEDKSVLVVWWLLPDYCAMILDW